MNWTKLLLGCVLTVFLGTGALLVEGKPLPESGSSHHGNASASELNWWKNAVIYEIYPRSFQDSNGDGIGDLNGITERLDYLKALGVDAIWLTPIYPSPQVDFGYDISDYEAIDPQYGTMADFDRLVAEAGKRHIRVMMDMVMNHTSDKHKWFLESRSSRTNPYRNWYVWHDGKGETATANGAPPNNWQSLFGGSAWQWDAKTRQYYYHRFYVQQPDLNWNNPRVHEAFKKIIAFWLKRGVGGFRFDAITALFEDPKLTDDGIVRGKNGKPIINAFGLPQLDSSKTDNLPGVHRVMQEMRAATDKFDSNRFPGKRVLIGETYLPDVKELEKMYGPPGKPEFELPMDMHLGIINKMDVSKFRAGLTAAETRLGGHTPLIVFDNHDNPRLDVRYGDGQHNKDIQRVISTVLFASGGASLMYYGDEIGMKTTPPTRKQDVKDPVGIAGWPENKGRDGERTPMQWNASANAGFSSEGVRTWLPIPPTYKAVNVKAEEAQPDSLLAWYRTLIRLKKSVPALEHGNYTLLNSQSDKVLSWMRKASGARPVVVAVNFTAQPQTVNLGVPGSGPKARTLLKTPGAAEPASLKAVHLGPFGVYIGEVEP